jgi:transposase InsO family protein
VVIKAADEFHEKTTRPNQLWQIDFTRLKVIGHAGGVPAARGWFYLSTILDDYSRYVIAWRLCTTMKAADVTSTLEDALVTVEKSHGSWRNLRCFPARVSIRPCHRRRLRLPFGGHAD